MCLIALELQRLLYGHQTLGVRLEPLRQMHVLQNWNRFFKKLLIVCDHPLPDVTWAKRGRPEGPKWIKCEKCGITILRKNSVRHQKHCKMTTISTKMKPSCRWCKKTSNHLSNIKCHEKICPHRPQFVKKLSPAAVWRIGMKVLFIFWQSTFHLQKWVDAVIKMHS